MPWLAAMCCGCSLQCSLTAQRLLTLRRCHLCTFCVCFFFPSLPFSRHALLRRTLRGPHTRAKHARANRSLPPSRLVAFSLFGAVFPLPLLLLLQAPEVVMGKYSEHADMWSLGVVMFVSLFGAYPQPRAHVPARPRQAGCTPNWSAAIRAELVTDSSFSCSLRCPTLLRARASLLLLQATLVSTWTRMRTAPRRTTKSSS